MDRGRRLGQRCRATDAGADQAQIAVRMDEPAVTQAAAILADVRDRVRVGGRLREREQQAQPQQPEQVAARGRAEAAGSHRRRS